MEYGFHRGHQLGLLNLDVLPYGVFQKGKGDGLADALGAPIKQVVGCFQLVVMGMRDPCVDDDGQEGILGGRSLVELPYTWEVW